MIICKGWVLRRLFESIQGVLSCKKYCLSALEFQKAYVSALSAISYT